MHFRECNVRKRIMFLFIYKLLRSFRKIKHKISHPLGEFNLETMTYTLLEKTFRVKNMKLHIQVHLTFI